MLSALRTRWRNLLSGLWFVPGVVALAFGVTAVALVRLDRRVATGFAFDGSEAAARDVLTTVAGSLMAVAGLAFSITIVTLQLVSGQYSPSAARTLLDDRVNQVAAGVFVGVVLYCLLVLRSIGSGASGDFVPRLAVTVGIAFAVLGFGMLLVFVNHVAQSIKLPRIAARIGRRTILAVERLHPDPYAARADEDADGARHGRKLGEPLCVAATRPGYVQQVRIEELVGAIGESVSRVDVEVRPGSFVSAGGRLASLWPADGADAHRAVRAVRRAIPIDDERDVAGDVAFGLQQLSDVAVRALSTGVNDPSTALTCVEYLASCLELLAARAIPPALRTVDGVEVAAPRAAFEDYAREAFDAVGRSAGGDPRLAAAVLEGLGRVARSAARAGAVERVATARETAARLAATASDRALTSDDRDRIHAAHLAAHPVPL